VSQHPLQLRAAYSVCRHIARSAARNFYYGFMALPAAKRNALSAVYAFMRRADDITDDPSIPPEQRREKLNDWMGAFHRVVAGERTDDPVLFALADAQKRYTIPLEWLERLVQGTAMDVPPPAAVPQAPDPSASSGQALGPQLRYETFYQLYDYCYHVASVVGLVCIRIFGYRDSQAEELAEKTGVAFQLTNILRDVKEDAGLGRVYLPREDFARFDIDPRVLTNGSAIAAGLKSGAVADPGHSTASEPGSGCVTASLRPLLEFEALRARAYYRAAEELLPLINDDSQAALWTLVEIYRRLLEKIIARNYDVFSERISLSPAEKLSVMVKGWWRYR